MTTTERLSVPLQALQVESNYKLETATDSDIPLADEHIKFIVEAIKEYVFAGWNALKIAEELTLDLQTKLKADERDNLADMAAYKEPVIDRAPHYLRILILEEKP